MSREHVNHGNIVQFAQTKVNLSSDKASEYRAQVRRLREKLEGYLSEHPDFTLKKILLSGSLAKGTALNSLNDIDVACYISGADVPKDIQKLLDYLAERLKKAFPNFSPDQVQPQTYSVTVSFKTTELDVDIVPILYDNDPDWYGNLVSQDDGTFLKTCIPRHLDFIKARKQRVETDFAQVVRLAKYWAWYIKKEQEGFRFKSFMIELILAKLADDGLDFTDYPEALQHFFTYIIKSELKEQITFSDYYPTSQVPAYKDPIRIIDPVNADNNASKLYTTNNAKAIIEAALDASEAIDSALYATTKEKTVYYWQKVFGPTFNA